MERHRVTVMQPYLFPYLGYFQLIYGSDSFVFYDDVNYIKGGWINRNRILLQNEAKMLTFPCQNLSPNVLINEVHLLQNPKFYNKLLRTIEQSYKKAPYFNEAYHLIEKIILNRPERLSEFAIKSTQDICEYIELEKKWYVSSLSFNDSKGQGRSERLISICKKLGATDYINAIGGRELYTKQYFKERKVNLWFLDSQLKTYKQFNKLFVPALSIIDLLMFMDPEQIHTYLNDYNLI